MNAAISIRNKAVGQTVPAWERYNGKGRVAQESHLPRATGVSNHNGLIKLEYSPATDILQVNYPDLYSYQLTQVRRSLSIMVDTIRNYDVKRLLLDASVTSIHITDKENSELSLNLGRELSKTRLQKVARIPPLSSVRESIAQKNL